MYDHARLFARLLQVSTTDPAASLRVVSRRLGVHPHTLTHLVREHTGASFSDWRAHRRVSGACRLLRTRPELSIKEVAAASGFSATSVFDRFLRRACGRTPSECRRSPRPEGPADAEHSCMDRPGRAHRAKVNVLVHSSTDEGMQLPGADATLDIGRSVRSTGTSRSPT
ncbi:MAG: helix-turn-helix domain-containing protein [Vicinamibacterales bacterium]